MTPFVATGSAVIQASAERVYSIIAEYREGHPRIVPPKYFTSLEVEQVTIATELKLRGGLLGCVERFIIKRVLRRIYAQELALLAEVARS
jgi:hypothetical protein